MRLHDPHHESTRVDEIIFTNPSGEWMQFFWGGRYQNGDFRQAAARRREINRVISTLAHIAGPLLRLYGARRLVYTEDELAYGGSLGKHGGRGGGERTEQRNNLHGIKLRFTHDLGIFYCAGLRLSAVATFYSPPSILHLDSLPPSARSSGRPPRHPLTLCVHLQHRHLVASPSGI